jgi:transcriptional regulator with XRE-family HTH domain
MSTLGNIPETVATLGEAIRYVREQRGLSLRELARRVGVSAPFLSDVERNRRATDKLAEVARALGVSLTELERFDSRLPPDIKEWIASSPGVSSLLRELRDSGMDVYALRTALQKKKR